MFARKWMCVAIGGALATFALSSLAAEQAGVPKDGSGSGDNSWIGHVDGGNDAAGIASGVAAGTSNFATGDGGFIGGGGCNVASGGDSVVAGGGQSGSDVMNCTYGNVAEGDHSVVGGGYSNIATKLASSICGGGGNNAFAIASTIGGGLYNTTGGFRSTVAGGGENTASGNGSAVGGGNQNTAAGAQSTVAGGFANTASGDYSAVAGGYANSASGDFSVALGRQAKALSFGSFVFGDSTNTDVTANTPNQFLVAASGGITMATNKDLSTGCFIPAGGGSWNCTSDRNAKRDFAPIAVQSILSKVAALPLSMWSYSNETSGARHIGPTAQDFREAFGLGHDERSIALVDTEGVALAAIQALHQLMQEKDSQIASLKAKAQTQEDEMADLRRTVDRLLKRLQ